VGKVTPTKSGLFVAIWRRGDDGSCQPFDNANGPDHTDWVDLLVISARNEANFGVFVFPTPVLVDRGIVAGGMSVGTRSGKRGFRLYPPWSTASSRQAEITQQWQINYFLDLTNLDLAASETDGDTDWARRASRLFASRCT
jgi:hypothetical protein